MPLLSAFGYTIGRMRSTKADSRHAPALTLAAACCAVVLAACGSSSNSGNGARSSFSMGVRFADCMRSHGVPNFPDPGSGGGIQIGAGIDPRAPAFRSAQSACTKLLPGGGPPPLASESRKLEMLRLARCMRRHGLSTFPDPVASPPAPGNGLGIAFGAPGSFIAVPQTMLQSPGFNQAAAACGFPGFGGGGGAKTSSAPG